MARRTPQKSLSEGDILHSEVQGRDYPVDVLKDLFVKSGMTPKRIAQKYSLPLDKLLDYAETFHWFRLKKDHDRMELFTALNMREDSFLQHLTADQREQALKIKQRNQELNEVEKHFDDHGHLFCVDEYGEILRNKISGLPIKMNFGSSKEELQERRELQGSVELNVKLLAENMKRAPILIDVEAEESNGIKVLNSPEQAADAVFSEKK